MNNNLQSIWQKTLDLLKDELSELGFNTFIKPIEPIYMDSDSIILGVPDNFFKGQVESKYGLLIKNAIKQITHKECNINFIIPSEEDVKVSQDTSENNSYDDNNQCQLNPKYTFDTFVIGNSNRLAHAAAVAVAESPSKAYNPLFIYGGVGLGKTHLMHAIGHYIKNQNPSAKVVYVSSEKFTNQLVNAIKSNKNEEFRRRYRNVDVLLIDDVQFIGGRERTQEEFFHTFNDLYEDNKQIIISSDKPPKEITTLEERLRSRFEWGLQADIQPPDLETRIAILSKRAQLDNIYVPDDVISLIAERIASNIRELEGALNRVVAYASLTKSELTLEIAEEALKNILQSNKAKIITSSLIIESVARYYDLRPEEFTSKKRNRDIAYPRQIAMYLCRNLTDLSLPKIGEAFGGRDHTTVLHAIDKINSEIESNIETRRAVDEIKRNILGK